MLGVGKLDRLGAVLGVADHFDLFVVRQECLERPGEECLVVRDQDANVNTVCRMTTHVDNGPTQISTGIT